MEWQDSLHNYNTLKLEKIFEVLVKLVVVVTVPPGVVKEIGPVVAPAGAIGPGTLSEKKLI